MAQYTKEQIMHELTEILVNDFEIYGNILSNMLSIPMITLDNIHMITKEKTPGKWI